MSRLNQAAAEQMEKDAIWASRLLPKRFGTTAIVPEKLRGEINPITKFLRNALMKYYRGQGKVTQFAGGVAGKVFGRSAGRAIEGGGDYFRRGLIRHSEILPIAAALAPIATVTPFPETALYGGYFKLMDALEPRILRALARSSRGMARMGRGGARTSISREITGHVFAPGSSIKMGSKLEEGKMTTLRKYASIFSDIRSIREINRRRYASELAAHHAKSQADAIRLFTQMQREIADGNELSSLRNLIAAMRSKISGIPSFQARRLRPLFQTDSMMRYSGMPGVMDLTKITSLQKVARRRFKTMLDGTDE